MNYCVLYHTVHCRMCETCLRVLWRNKPGRGSIRQLMASARPVRWKQIFTRQRTRHPTQGEGDTFHLGLMHGLSPEKDVELEASLYGHIEAYGPCACPHTVTHLKAWYIYNKILGVGTKLILSMHEVYCNIGPSNEVYCNIGPSNEVYCNIGPPNEVYCSIGPPNEVYCSIGPPNEVYCSIGPPNEVYCCIYRATK